MCRRSPYQSYPRFTSLIHAFATASSAVAGLCQWSFLLHLPHPSLYVLVRTLCRVLDLLIMDTHDLSPGSNLIILCSLTRRHLVPSLMLSCSLLGDATRLGFFSLLGLKVRSSRLIPLLSSSLHKPASSASGPLNSSRARAILDGLWTGPPHLIGYFLPYTVLVYPEPLTPIFSFLPDLRPPVFLLFSL